MVGGKISRQIFRHFGRSAGAMQPAGAKSPVDRQGDMRAGKKITPSPEAILSFSAELRKRRVKQPGPTNAAEMRSTTRRFKIQNIPSSCARKYALGT